MNVKSRRKPVNIPGIIATIILAIGAVFILVPLIWTVNMALKPASEVAANNFWVQDPQLSNFKEAVTAIPFFEYLMNTICILIPVMIGTLCSCTFVAYGFSRFNFKYRNFWFMVLLSTMMLPSQITLIPTYLMWRAFGFVGTSIPLIVPAFFGGGAFNIFLMRQYMNQIPMDFDEAAYLDGCSRFGILIRIIVPMCKPVLTAITVFTFMGVWNDFNGPLIYLNDSSDFTLAVGLSFFKGMYTSEWNLLMAATLLTILPVIIVFFAAQKYIIDGISMSSGTKM